MGTCSSMRRRMMMSGGEVSMPNYLYFTALESGSFTVSIAADTSVYQYIEYSLDGSLWQRITNTSSTVTETINVSEGDVVYWRGYSPNRRTGNRFSSATTFGSTCKYTVSGNALSLVLINQFEGKEGLSVRMPALFKESTLLVSVDENILPSTNLQAYAYEHMFLGCTSLTNPPNLPARTFASDMLSVYSCMFQGCTKMSSAPILYPTTLKTLSYNQMFQNCKAIKYLKMYATDVSASQCLKNWMYGVTNNSTCIFVKNINATWTTTGNSGVPTNWTVIYYDPTEDKYYTSQDKSQECDDHGNPI